MLYSDPGFLITDHCIGNVVSNLKCDVIFEVAESLGKSQFLEFLWNVQVLVFKSSVCTCLTQYYLIKSIKFKLNCNFEFVFLHFCSSWFSKNDVIPNI